MAEVGTAANLAPSARSCDVHDTRGTLLRVVGLARTSVPRTNVWLELQGMLIALQGVLQIQVHDTTKLLGRRTRLALPILLSASHCRSRTVTRRLPSGTAGGRGEMHDLSSGEPVHS